MAHKVDGSSQERNPTESGPEQSQAEALELADQTIFEARLVQEVGSDWFGGALRVLCEERGQTIRELERIIPPRVLGRLFTGALRDRSYYARVASKLGCTLDAVFERAKELESKYGQHVLPTSSYDQLASFVKKRAREQGYTTRSSYDALVELSSTMLAGMFREPERQSNPLMYYLLARALDAEARFDALFSQEHEAYIETLPLQTMQAPRRAHIASVGTDFGLLIWDHRGTCHLVQPLHHETAKTKHIAELDLNKLLSKALQMGASVHWHRRSSTIEPPRTRLLKGAVVLILGTECYLASLIVPLTQIDIAGIGHEVVDDGIRCMTWRRDTFGDLPT